MPFDELNADALGNAADRPALGPYVGQFEGFALAWEADNRASAVLGIHEALADKDAAQLRALREAGVQDAPAMDERMRYFYNNDEERPWTIPGRYMDFARYYVKGGDQETSERLRLYDEKIESLRKTHPDLNLKTSRELVSETLQEGAQAEARAQNSRGGGVGRFFGSAAAGLNYRTNPLNVVTLPVGGAGKTVIGRVATQVGAQGAIEALNQITGVQEQRELMGLSHGWMDGVSRVGGAAIGGAVAQGLGEAVGYGLRAGGKRFFRNVPEDPAPHVEPPAPPPPGGAEGPPPGAEWGNRREYVPIQDSLRTAMQEAGIVQPRTVGGRLAESRAASDLTFLDERLQAWDGEAPALIKPEMMTRTFNDVGVRFADDVATRRTLGKLTVDEIARDVDPDTFRIFDGLAARKESLRSEIAGLSAGRSPAEPVNITGRQTIDTALEDIQSRIDGLQVQREAFGISKRKMKDIDKQVAKLQKELEDNSARVRSTDTADVAALRDELMKTDYKMRDLYPTVSRAYARAQGQWDLSQEYKQLVKDMVRKGDRKLGEPTGSIDTKAILRDSPVSLAEKAPLMAKADTVAGRVAADASPLDIAAAVVKKEMEVMDEALQVYRDSLDKVLKEENGELTIAGTDVKFNIDKDGILVPNEDGEGFKRVSIRQLLEDNAETEYDLKAVQTCSI